jgi:hypothetical protein
MHFEGFILPLQECTILLEALPHEVLSACKTRRDVNRRKDFYEPKRNDSWCFSLQTNQEFDIMNEGD